MSAVRDAAPMPSDVNCVQLAGARRDLPKAQIAVRAVFHSRLVSTDPINASCKATSGAGALPGASSTFAD